MPIVRLEKNKHSGKRCFILGTGPGLNRVNLSLLKNEITIGMNLILKKKGFVPNYLVVGDTTLFEHAWDTIWNDKMKRSCYVVSSGCNMVNTKQHRVLNGICTTGRGSTCDDRFNLPNEYNIHTIRHEEKSGAYQQFFRRDPPNQKDKIVMTRLDEYYMDSDFRTYTGYGCSTMDNIAIPLAVYLGCKEIYMIGADGGHQHFYDASNRIDTKRHVEYSHVLTDLKDKGTRLFNTDPSNAFSEVEYKKYEDLFKG